MKKTNAIRVPLLSIAFFGRLNGFAHAADTPAAPGDAEAVQGLQAGSNASATKQASSAAPTTLSQASTVTAPLSAPPQFAQPTSWNDTYIGYRVGTNFYYPGVRTASGAPAKITQNIGFLTTTGGFKYGSYAFNVDYLVSSMANPEAGPTSAYGYPTPGSGGAQEVYSVGRVTLSAGKIFGRPMSYDFIRDFGLTAGYEFGTKNDAYAERARMLVVGPTVEFAIPRGFWNGTLGVRTESNHDGITNVDVHFNPAVHLESFWLYRPGSDGIQRLRQPHRSERQGRFRRADHDGVPRPRVPDGGRRIVRWPSAHRVCGYRLRILAQHVRHAALGATRNDQYLGSDAGGRIPLLTG
jgi:hypothetical protein